MNEKVIPYIQHEAELYRQERLQVRLWYFCAVLLALIVISNVLWLLWYMEISA